jgi:hypothetical protein
MAIVYRIYSNGGSGGAINYAQPIATTADTSFTTGVLTAPGSYQFGVHAYDTSSGVEELNTQASVSITLDANGNDVGQAPLPPYSLIASSTANGGCRVAWTYPSRTQGPLPVSFLVYLTPGPTPSFSTPVATIAFGSGLTAYSCQLGGLSDGVSYTVAVMSQSAGGVTSGPIVAAVVGDSTPPQDVDVLTATAIP